MLFGDKNDVVRDITCSNNDIFVKNDRRGFGNIGIFIYISIF